MSPRPSPRDRPSTWMPLSSGVVLLFLPEMFDVPAPITVSAFPSRSYKSIIGQQSLGTEQSIHSNLCAHFAACVEHVKLSRRDLVETVLCPASPSCRRARCGVHRPQRCRDHNGNHAKPFDPQIIPLQLFKPCSQIRLCHDDRLRQKSHACRYPGLSLDVTLSRRKFAFQLLSHCCNMPAHHAKED